jgi:SAM-dependent methyltransferase
VTHNVGTGPGEITPDGCAVEFYALLPPMGEPSIVHAAVPEGASILELGCGTGRILRPLADLGHPVLGVDESPAMLAHLTDLPSACAPIETLRLGRTFDAVLLASTMLNTTRRSGAPSSPPAAGTSARGASWWSSRPLRAGSTRSRRPRPSTTGSGGSSDRSAATVRG